MCVQVTSGGPPAFDSDWLRNFDRAKVHHERAPRTEAAAAWRIERAGQVAARISRLAVRCRSGSGNGTAEISAPRYGWAGWS